MTIKAADYWKFNFPMSPHVPGMVGRRVLVCFVIIFLNREVTPHIGAIVSYKQRAAWMIVMKKDNMQHV